MSSQPRVLVVDDDPHIRQVVRFALEKAGFAVSEAGDGEEALERFAAGHYDLVVLDILMPELDGTEVCRRLRAGSRVPILFLSSKDEEIDRIVGLELGGDDYVTKPFSPRELTARVKAILRRTAAAGTADEGQSRWLGHGRLRLDLDRFLALWDDREVTLTATEFGIVQTLLGYPGRVYSRDEVLARAYPGDAEVSDRTIDSHVRRIRRKFAAAGGDPIETVHGMGYRIAPCR